jgi:hypothetical protein
MNFFLLVFLVASVFAATETDDAGRQPEDQTPFQELLKQSDKNAIHVALHSLSDKFRHGVFATDTNAIEAIHNEDAPLATHLLKLARRQGVDGNNATTTATRSPTSQTSVVTPPASESSSEATTSQSGFSTTISVATTVTTASTSASSTSVSTAGPTTLTTSASPSTTTTAATTTSPGITTPITSTYKQTTTLPNGSLSTFTAVTVVQPTQGGQGGGAVATATTTPSLQSGACTTHGLTMEVLALLGGAIAVAMAL